MQSCRFNFILHHKGVFCVFFIHMKLLFFFGEIDPKQEMNDGHLAIGYAIQGKNTVWFMITINTGDLVFQ